MDFRVVLESFLTFVGLVLWIGIFAAFFYRVKLYRDLYRIMKKYPREFDKLGIDQKLLYVPEFCNFKKIKSQLDMSNEEIASLIKRLNISKYSLWGSFAVFMLFGILGSQIIKIIE